MLGRKAVFFETSYKSLVQNYNLTLSCGDAGFTFLHVHPFVLGAGRASESVNDRPTKLGELELCVSNNLIADCI
jgi:hypothetical protein